MMTFQAYGDTALLISREQKIDPEINAFIISLKNTIENSSIPGITFCIPAYCSLTVGYDPLTINFDQLCEKVKSLISKKGGKVERGGKRKLTIPVCYEADFALDFSEVMELTGLSKEAIIQMHTSTPFQVYMLGFLPGFPYMGKLPEALFCKRKAEPRLKVPARSVGLAGYQTGIYPSEAPGGWQIIGKTPLTIFNAKKENPFLFKAGDFVQFQQVSLSDFENIEKDIASGNFNLSSIYG